MVQPYTCVCYEVATRCNPVNMPTTSPDVPLLGALYDQPFSLELLIDHLKGERAPNCSAWIGNMDRRGEQGWSTPMLYLAVDPWYNSVNDQEGLRSLRARIALLRSIEGNSSLGLRECVTNALLR